MLDIMLFRADKGGNPDLVRESQRRRCAPVEAVDEVIALDKAWREARYRLDQRNADYAAVNKEIGMKKKNKEEVPAELIEKAQAIDKEIEVLKQVEKTSEKEVENKLKSIGNIVHESVPVSDNEDNNTIVKQWGETKTREGLHHHHELLEMIGGYAPEAGTEIAGHRGYFLTGPGALLQLAIINYAMNFLASRDYSALIPPYFMKTSIMGKTAQLSQFDEELYKLQLTEEEDKEQEKCLIATSEQPISALHMGEWIEEKALPKKYVGYSTCFRKEAGAHGRDVWGIFRVHQFDKVEQFVLTEPEKSWQMHEEMLLRSEEFYQSLGLPYRVVSIVSGALNNAASKKYDLEGWFPTLANYRELVSCSNCTDFQSRALEVRCGQKKQGQQAKKYVHMLNSTLCATTRTICAILENYQTEDGINVPEVLVPLMGGVKKIPFIKAKPKKQAHPQQAKPAAK
eukprot:TRINITY_DN1182_c0_g1_i1.p1 TRINITY_DN1182_c0_g1~~TRINITY_DN1182_c0_g1_i1.p1  ORF type:complete len:456 (+),score=171.07 TRINITY_DN1182_c0_g1_i1:92-1459(+)